MAARQATAKSTAKSKSRRDPLKEYRRKRDFNRTSEPTPEPAKTDGHEFVVQKHAARRLHYDLRLEHGGTLKSWAVTRGPSLIAGEKRLAVQTEDHPMQYLEFEGNIPKGEYGGGSMIVWDRGKWDSAYDPDYGFKKGHLDITLHGSRLKGRWHLVRMKKRAGERNEQWLLIKSDDEFARHAGEPDITDEETTSTISGLTNEQLAARGDLRVDHADRAKAASTRKQPLPDAKKTKGARKRILPEFIEPTLPQTSDKAPSGAKWVHEIKYDGYRTQARIDGTKVQLLTRKGLDWTARFKPIAAALKTLGLGSALIDGEIVVEDSAGLPSFMLLQQDLSAERTDRLRYFAFDLLYYEGYDLLQANLADRKALLQQIISRMPASAPVRFSDHLAQDGPTVFEHAARIGLEGIISKRLDMPYRSGRVDHWLKIKGRLRQEFVILGYTPSTVAKGTIGALLLGYYNNNALYYAGRVGSGFSGDQARALYKQLEQIAADKPKLENKLPAGAEKGVRWIEPRLVGEVEFRGWTADKLVRQAAFKGLREDRPAEEVTLESVPKEAAPTRGRDVLRGRLTHPERILWPEAGVSKEGLAEFYTDIADWILPHVTGRVLSLVRCPSGAGEKCFFAKHAWAGLSKAVRHVDVGDAETMLAIDGMEGLIDLVQAGVLEIHPWGSTVKQLEKPDRLIFDLDPGEGVPWSAVIDGAIELRSRLDDLGLTTFVKTSGGKGLHVVVPLTPSAGWDEAKEFTHEITKAMAAASPDRYVATMSKKLRRGKIFIDYLRNGRGATAVAPYSTRALPMASVSTPLAWDELSEGLRSDHFRVDNLRQRLAVLKDDPWTKIFTVRQKLPR